MMRVLFLLLVVHAATAQEGAITAYRRGDFALAEALFSSSPDAETDAGILANRGNCAFRLGRFADALVLFRRAELRDPANADIVFNRRRAESRLGLESSDDRTALGSLEPWLRRAEHPATVVFFLAIECIGLWVAFYGRRLRSSRIGVTVAVAALLLGGTAILARLWPRKTAAIVVAKEAVVRAEPHADERSVVLLGAGETVTVEMMSDRWMKISHRRGAGWIERGAATLVD